MKYNLYSLLDDFSIANISVDALDTSIKERLLIIEKEIILEFLKKQKGKLGIRNLGNELRYNKILKEQFNYKNNDKLIIKLTENRRAFIKVFIDNWIDNNNNKEIYFFILEGEFGIASNMVDNSFIRINEIREELSNFNNYFKKTTFGPKIKFIEVKGFEKYNLIDNEGYTQIQLNK